MADETYQHSSNLDPVSDLKSAESFRFSLAQDIAVPMAVAIVPAGLFLLMGVLLEGVDRPDAKTPWWRIGIAMGLQTMGIVAMAVVVLIRREALTNQLVAMSRGPVSRWRAASLLLALCSLTLFDILINVSSAFEGAMFLAVFAPLIFLLYLLVIKLTFWGLSSLEPDELVEVSTEFR